jgi:hypothetical protein
VLPRVTATLEPLGQIVTAEAPYHCDIAGWGKRWGRSLLGGVVPGLKGAFGPVTQLHVNIGTVNPVNSLSAGKFILPGEPCPEGFGP